MIQPKYSAEESLQLIKLRINYDSLKTLNENKKVIKESKLNLILEGFTDLIDKVLKYADNFAGKLSDDINQLVLKLKKAATEEETIKILADMANSSDEMASIIIPKIMSTISGVRRKYIDDFKLLLKDAVNEGADSTKLKTLAEDWVNKNVKTQFNGVKDIIKKELIDYIDNVADNVVVKVDNVVVKTENPKYVKILRKGLKSGMNHPSILDILTNLKTPIGEEKIKGWKYLMRYITTQTPVNLELKKCFSILVESGFDKEFAKQITYKIGQLGGSAIYRVLYLTVLVTFIKIVKRYIEQQGGEEYIKRKNENELSLLVDDIANNFNLLSELLWYIPAGKTFVVLSGVLHRKPYKSMFNDILGNNTDEEKELKKLDPNYNESQIDEKIINKGKEIINKGKETITTYSSNLFYREYPCYTEVLDTNYNENEFIKGVKIISPTKIQLMGNTNETYSATLKTDGWYFSDETKLTCEKN
jgi:hypothetical protein